jgi:hypothetical protein
VSSNFWDIGPQNLRKSSTKTLREGILFGLQAYLSQSFFSHPNEDRNDLTKRSSCLSSNVDAYLENDKMCEMTPEESPLNLGRFLLNYRCYRTICSLGKSQPKHQVCDTTGNTYHCHLNRCPPHFSEGQVQHKGGFPG